MRHIFVLVITLSLLFSPMIKTIPMTSGEAGYSAGDLLAIKPELRDETAAALPDGMTEYAIEIVIPGEDPAEGLEIDGSQQVVVTNTTNSVLTELPFRLYANAPDEEAIVEITSIIADGFDTDWTLSEGNSVATVALPDALESGEVVTLEMTFSLDIPVDDSASYGMLSYAMDNDTTVMAHWYPVLAGRDPVTGWMLKPPSEHGDPLFTDAAMYDVTISAPVGLSLITSGVETQRDEENGRVTTSFNAKPSRDFVIVTSGQLEPITTGQDGTTVTSWHMPNHQNGGEAVAEWTANSLEVFNPLLGEYPWSQLQVVEADVFAAAAVEFPQMFVMGSSYYDDSNIGTMLSYFEFTVAHETVHMWFYSLVGNNQYEHAFTDEGLTNYLSGDVYFRKMYGNDAGDSARKQFLYIPFERMIDSNSDVIVDFPTDDFPNSRSYVSAVYTKAPLGFHAIHTEMGDEAFFGALHDYVDDFRFRVATPADLEAALQAHTDLDIHAIWSHWFERREGSLDIRGAKPIWSA